MNLRTKALKGACLFCRSCGGRFAPNGDAPLPVIGTTSSIATLA
jgi:hypothetical protein